MAEEEARRLFWVRTERGQVWGPYTLAALGRLKGQFSEKCQASLDGRTFRPGSEFPELKGLLVAAAAPAPARERADRAEPRISPAVKAMLRVDSAKKDPAAAARRSHPVNTHEAAAAAQATAPATAGSAAVEADPPPSAAPAASTMTEAPLEVPAQGELSESSPVRLYALAAFTGATGRVELRPESGGALEISFRRGTPEHLKADDRELSLLRFLQSRSVLSAAQVLQAEERARQTGGDVVAALFQLQLIPPAEVHRLLGAYCLSLLDRALEIWRGRFVFHKNASPPPGAFPLGERWAILSDAVRRLDATSLRARLGKRLRRPVQRSGGGSLGRIAELALNAQESRLYATIDGTRTAEELLKVHDPALVLRLLFLLVELGHLSFGAGAEEETPPASARAGPTATAKRISTPSATATPHPTATPNPNPTATTTPNPTRTAGASPPQSSPPRVAGAGRAAPSAPESASRPAAPAAPSAARPAPPAAAAESAPAPPRPSFAEGPPGEAPAAQLARLGSLLQKLEKATHYEALGLERKATAADVKKAFVVLARTLHPDTVTDPAQVELRDVKERLFARVNEAAQVLGDAAQRKEYDAELEGSAGKVDLSHIFAAEEKFQRAEILIKAHKYADGLALLDEAIALNDKEAEFYAWRGYARFLVSKDRKAALAESAAECAKALKMVEKCLPAHLFLGHMHKIVGDAKSAAASYKRVLQIDPKHTDAQRELRVLGIKS